MKKHTVIDLVLLAALLGAGTAHAQRGAAQRGAEARMFNYEATVVRDCVSESGVSMAAAACIVTQLTETELNKCLRYGVGGDRGCFGRNNTLMGYVVRNVDASARESGDLAKAARILTGVSWADAVEYGPLGGRNSDARKLCTGIAKIFGGHCDVD